jgi:hypothetical protein
MWNVYTMEYYSVTKKDKVMSFIWMKLEIIMLSEISKTQKDKYQMFCLICLNLGKNIMKVEGDCQRRRRGRGGEGKGG